MNAILALSFFCLASAVPVEPLWNASVGADGVLRVDSSKERAFEWARYAMTSRETVLKPNMRYEITFRARVEGLAPDSYLSAIIRPESTGGAEKDVGDLPQRFAAARTAVRPATAPAGGERRPAET